MAEPGTLWLLHGSASNCATGSFKVEGITKHGGKQKYLPFLKLLADKPTTMTKTNCGGTPKVNIMQITCVDLLMSGQTSSNLA